MNKEQPQSSLRLQFIGQSLDEDSLIDGDPGSRSIALELDNHYNISVYGQQKSVFAPGESAYLKMMPGVSASYRSSAGSISRQASNVPYVHVENVSFAMTRSASLQFAPNGSVSWEWLGHSGGSPLFEGRTVTLQSDTVGVLRCQYTVMGTRLRLLVNNWDMGLHEAMEVIVVAVAGEQQASALVRYSRDAEMEPVPYDLSVSDFCSGEVVSGVHVYLDGVSVGTTNASGRIHLGELKPGTIHQLKMTKDGYIDSDNDVLHNDSFTVPTA